MIKNEKYGINFYNRFSKNLLTIRGFYTRVNVGVDMNKFVLMHNVSCKIHHVEIWVTIRYDIY